VAQLTAASERRVDAVLRNAGTEENTMRTHSRFDAHRIELAIHCTVAAAWFGMTVLFVLS
jgi:hypothetical protein